MDEEQKRKLIDDTVARIVATKADGEPFDTADKFWTSGFHRMAFEYLVETITSVLLTKIAYSDEPCPNDLLSELDAIASPDIRSSDAENIAHQLALSMEWIEFKAFRKAVIRRLNKTSFSYLGPTIHDEKTKNETYMPPSWA